MQYVLEAHTETINMLIDITAQGGCNVLITQLLENIKETATFTKPEWFGQFDNVWAWFTGWFSWDWLIWGVIGVCSVLLVICIAFTCISAMVRKLFKKVNVLLTR